MNMLNYYWKDHLKEYILVIVVLLILYYAYVILRYYRKEMKSYAKGAGHQGYERDIEIIDPFEKYHDEEPQQADEESYTLAAELVERARGLIAEAAEQGIEQTEVIASMRRLVQEYPSLKDPVLQAGITELIIEECKEAGAVQLSESAMNGLWRGRLS